MTRAPALSPLSLGSWHTWDRMQFEDSVEVVRTAVDAGVNLFDVGHYNVGPHPEGSHTDVLLSRVLQASGIERSRYLVCHKLWLWRWPEQSLADQLAHALFRFGDDHADVVILGDFLGELDIARVVDEVGGLVRAGRISHWGVNNWSAEDLARTCELASSEGIPTPCLAQLKYSVCRRSVADGEPYARIFSELGVGLQASDVLEGGVLAGRQPERRIGMDTGGIREAIATAAPRLGEVAASLGATPAQAAIAFCLAHPHCTNVLFGASRMEQLVENLGAVDLATAHGAQLRALLDDLWVDRDVVEPTASWGTTRAQAIAAGGT